MIAIAALSLAIVPEDIAYPCQRQEGACHRSIYLNPRHWPMTKTGHADSRFCAVTTASTGIQHPGQRSVYFPSACSEALFSHPCITIWGVKDHLAILQMPEVTAALESVPEHWLKHMQRVADARSMKGYAHPSGHMKQHARLTFVHPL